MKMYFTVSTIKFTLGEDEKHIKLVMRETQKYKIVFSKNKIEDNQTNYDKFK